MRINVYGEEMTDRIEIIEKKTKDGSFTGLRIYLELPVTMEQCTQCGNIRPAENASWEYFEKEPPHCACGSTYYVPIHANGPFMHHPDDDDSSAVTFWGKRDLREVLRAALAKLDEHYAKPRG
jgi:hypothetical protein